MREPQKKFVLSFAEIVVIIFIFIVAFCIFTAKVFDVKQESNIIYKWKETLNAAQYSYKVVYLTESEKLKEISVLDFESRNKALFELFGKTINFGENSNLNRYKYRFLNGKRISKYSKYYVRDFRIMADGGVIAGISWTNPDCLDNDKACGVMIFDMNGKKGPNRMGLDVFGADIYGKGLEPFGAGLSYRDNEKNCGRLESGVTCSQFYLIGGQFFK